METCDRIYPMPIDNGLMKAKIMVKSTYNYPTKLNKALSEGNTKYIKKLIEKGIVIIDL